MDTADGDIDEISVWLHGEIQKLSTIATDAEDSRVLQDKAG